MLTNAAFFLTSVVLYGIICTAGAQKVVPKFNLTCWSCTKQTHGMNCITMQDTSLLEQRSCDITQTYCKVERRFVNKENATYIDAFERGCDETCNAGCVSAGNSNRYVLGRCTSCCGESYCNVGSGCPTMTAASMRILTTSAMLVLSCMRFFSKRS